MHSITPAERASPGYHFAWLTAQPQVSMNYRSLSCSVEECNICHGRWYHKLTHTIPQRRVRFWCFAAYVASCPSNRRCALLVAPQEASETPRLKSLGRGNAANAALTTHDRGPSRSFKGPWIKKSNSFTRIALTRPLREEGCRSCRTVTWRSSPS